MSGEQGMWKAAHCGKQGRSRVLERDGGRELEDRASSGTARNLPEGERSHCRFLTPCRHHLQTGYTLPQGRVSLLSLPGSSPPPLAWETRIQSSSTRWYPWETVGWVG